MRVNVIVEDYQVRRVQLTFDGVDSLAEALDLAANGSEGEREIIADWTYDHTDVVDAKQAD